MATARAYEAPRDVFENATLGRRRSPAGHAPLGLSREGLSSALATLPLPYAAIIERCDVQGESRARVARDLGYSLRHFYRLRRRALAAVFAATTTDARATVSALALDDRVRLGRLVLLHARDPAMLLGCEAIRDAARDRGVPDDAASERVARAAERAADDVPPRMRAAAESVAVRARVIDLARDLGLQRRQAFRLRRDACDAAWDVFCRRLERQSAAVCRDVRARTLRAALADYQRGGAARAAATLKAAFCEAHESEVHAALLVPVVEVACASGDRTFARAAVLALVDTAGTFAVERAVAQTIVDGWTAAGPETSELSGILHAARADERGPARAHALVQGYVIEANARTLAGECRAAEPSAQRALALCARMDDPEPMLEARALCAAGGIALFRPGRIATGVRLLRKSYARCIDSELRRERLAVLHDLGGACVLAGNDVAALDRFRTVLDEPALLSPSQRFWTSVIYANTLARGMRGAIAGRVLATIVDAERDTDMRAAVALTRAEIALRRDPHAALELGQVAATLFTSARLRAAARCVQSEALFALGRRDQAKSACFEMLEAFSDGMTALSVARGFRLAARLTGSTDYARTADALRSESAVALSDRGA